MKRTICPSGYHGSRQRGDTIIEVLIVTAVVSLVMTTAYVITNRNVRTQQNIQEQAQAQKLVGQQLEALRREPDPTAMTGKCYAANLVPQDGTDCSVDANGVTASAGSGAVFKLLITYEGSDVYVASATWETLGGQQSTIKMYYYKK